MNEMGPNERSDEEMHDATARAFEGSLSARGQSRRRINHLVISLLLMYYTWEPWKAYSNPVSVLGYVSSVHHTLSLVYDDRLLTIRSVTRSACHHVAGRQPNVQTSFNCLPPPQLVFLLFPQHPNP
jgi:hypothetical protein